MSAGLPTKHTDMVSDQIIAQFNVQEVSVYVSICLLKTHILILTQSTPFVAADLLKPYTAGLGAPDHLLNSSNKSSVVTDGGDQQAKKLRLEYGPATSPRSPDSFLGFDEFPGSESQFDLQSKILAAFKRNRYQQSREQEFLPKGELYRLINTTAVMRELKIEFGDTCDQKTLEGYAKRICTDCKVFHGPKGKTKIRSFRKIFALLVLVGTTPSICVFLDGNISDLDLPLLPPGPPAPNGLYRRTPSGLVTPISLDGRDKRKWSPVQIRTFLEYQWKMLAPFFAQDADGDIKHYILHDKDILPFVNTDAEQEAEDHNAEKLGGFGRVFMVRIHQDHHNFKDQALSKRGFAIKQQLDEEGRGVFQREITVLKGFSGARGHKHIVPLLATFEQFRRLHLIFYRAEGDLFAYWSSIKPDPSFSYDNILWMVEQCAGIAEALLRLHRQLSDINLPRDGNSDQGLPTSLISE
jgi:hypothetical protein